MGGLRLDLFYGKNENVTGLDLGVANQTTGKQTGVQLGFANIVDGDMSGVQFGYFGYSGVGGKRKDGRPGFILT